MKLLNQLLRQSRGLLVSAALLGGGAAQAQAPAWQAAGAVGRSSRLVTTATDDYGAVFVAGTFTGTLTLGGTVLTSAGDEDIFVAKRDGLTGTYLWAYRAGGTGADYASSLTIVSGAVYIGGSFGSPTADFGTTTLTNTSFGGAIDQLFVAKLADLGTSNQGFKWALQGTNSPPVQQSVTGLAVAGGSVYAVGSFQGDSLRLGTTKLLNATRTTHEMFVAKITDAGASGSFDWALGAGGTSEEYPQAVTATSGGVYVVGTFYSLAATFGSTVLTSMSTFPPFGGGMFVARVNDAGATGSFAWATTTNAGPDLETATSVAAVGGTVYVGGTYNGSGTRFGPSTLATAGGNDGYVARLNDSGTAGTFAWAVGLGSSSGEGVSAVAVGSRGVYVAGTSASNPLVVGPFFLNFPNTGSGGFLARLTDNSSSAAFDWAQGIDGNVYQAALALSGGIVWLGGTAGGAGAALGPYAVANANPGGSTGLLARLVDGQPDLNIRVGSTTYLSGSTYDFGPVPVGSSSGPRTFTIENLGTADGLTLLGTRDAGQTGGGTSFTPPFALAPGSTTFFTRDITPTTLGVQTGSVTVYSDDPDEPGYVVNFRLTGTAPADPANSVWTGASSTDWATPGNWNPAQVPGATTAVTIPVTPRQPLVSAAGAACASLAAVSGTTLTIAGAGYLTVENDFQTSGSTVMSGGTLESKGFYTYFNGGLNATGGTVLLSGNTVQEAGTNGGGCTFWNLTVGARPSNQVRAYGGGFAVRHVLTLRGDLDSGSSVQLLSDAAGTAMVVNDGGRVLGQGTMQRYVGGPNAGLGYRHVSSPGFFNAAAVFYGQGFAPVLNPAYNTTGNTVRPFPTFFGFDEARQGAAGVPGPTGFDQGWFSPATANDPLSANRGNGRGSTVQITGGSTLNASASFNTGPVAVGALSRSGSGPFAGYHLLGNPYPAPIAWANVARPAGLDDAVYVFRSTGQYTGFYDSFVNGLGTLANGEIAAMQGFFVRVSQPVPAFTFQDACRLTTYSNPTFRRGPADARPVLALALRPASGPTAEADKAFIYFEAGATATADARFDALKLPNPGGLNLASALGGQDYAVNGLPLLGTAPLVLPLAVSVPAAGRYELATDQLLNFAPGTALYLRDALLGSLTRLAPGTRYGFALTCTAAPGRFSVEFRPGGALASAGQVLEAQVAVWPNPVAAGAGLRVSAPAGATLTLRNVLGQAVLPTLRADATGSAQLPTAGLAAGLYLLRVQTGAASVSKPVVVE